MSVETRFFDIKTPTAETLKALGLGEREFMAVISTEAIDRDGEILKAGAFEPLPERIIVEIDHASFTGDRAGVRSVVGSGVPMYVGDELLIRGSYASTSLGEEVRTLVNEGHLTQMSIGFSTKSRETIGGVPHVVDGELLNVSFVTVPANEQARVLASKGAALEEKTEDRSDGEEEAVALVLGVDRPETVPADKMDEWTEAVRDFATGWSPPGQEEDPDEATVEDGAADTAALESAAALRLRQAARARAVLSTASHSDTGEQET